MFNYKLVIRKLKRKRNNVVRFLRPIIINCKWKIYKSRKGWMGINSSQYFSEGKNPSTKREEELVVSLTSFPERIGTVSETIKSLLLQSIKPDHLILWLADTQFPEKLKNLPIELLELCKYGLEIRWCEDIKSFKKLIPALKCFPDALIVTADDDLYYSSTWLEILYQSYKKYPDTIWVHRITKIRLENDKYSTTAGGWDIWSTPTYLNKLTGGSGCLYAPNMLYKDVVKNDLFMSLCPTSDDIWFWLMATMNNKKIMAPPKKQPLLVYVPGTQEGPTLTKINDHGKHLFWESFYAILQHYPELDTILREEYQRMSKELCKFTI